MALDKRVEAGWRQRAAWMRCLNETMHPRKSRADKAGTYLDVVRRALVSLHLPTQQHHCFIPVSRQQRAHEKLSKAFKCYVKCVTIKMEEEEKKTKLKAGG